MTRPCIGGGCSNTVTDPRYDLCDTCWVRVRDLVETAAQEVIAAAELILEEA